MPGSDLSEANRRWEGQVADFFNCPIPTKSYWESTEKQMNSSGIFPRIHVIAESSEDLERFARTEYGTRTMWRADHLHVDVQRHRMDRKGECRDLSFECTERQDVREEILAGTLDVPQSWRRKEVVWKLQSKT